MTEAEQELIRSALAFTTAPGQTARNYERLREAAQRVRRERIGAGERDVVARLEEFIKGVDLETMPPEFAAVQQALNKLQNRN